MRFVAIDKCKNDVESEVSRAVIHFEKEFMGRGPIETRTYLIDDLVIVRLKGVLTSAEERLAKSKSARSSYLLKQVRNELLTSGRSSLEAIIHDALGIKVQSVHTDISTKTGERIIVFTLESKVQFRDDDSENVKTDPSLQDRRLAM